MRLRARETTNERSLARFACRRRGSAAHRCHSEDDGSGDIYRRRVVSRHAACKSAAVAACPRPRRVRRCRRRTQHAGRSRRPDPRRAGGAEPRLRLFHQGPADRRDRQGSLHRRCRCRGCGGNRAAGCRRAGKNQSRIRTASRRCDGRRGDGRGCAGTVRRRTDGDRAGLRPGRERIPPDRAQQLLPVFLRNRRCVVIRRLRSCVRRPIHLLARSAFSSRTVRLCRAL